MEAITNMTAIDELKEEGNLCSNTRMLHDAILELDARVKSLELWTCKHGEILFDEQHKPTPTDEELVAKYKEPLINAVKFMIDPETLLHQLIAEVKP